MRDHENSSPPKSGESKEQDATNLPLKFSRRGFLKITGGGALGTALLGTAAKPTNAASSDQAESFKGFHKIQLQVNGQMRSLEIEPRTTLLSALRENLQVTGPKEVCDRGECGACTVLMNGKPVLACMTLAFDAVGKEVLTVEGLVKDGKLDPVQQAFVEKDALMCGFCTPGFVMSVRALLNKNPNPTETEVRKAVSGNLCRCGTYPRVFEAALAAAKTAAERRS